MNARSVYTTYDVQILTDRRGARRAILLKAGRNKGKRYPYSSTRQMERQRGN